MGKLKILFPLPYRRGCHYSSVTNATETLCFNTKAKYTVHTKPSVHIKHTAHLCLQPKRENNDRKLLITTAIDLYIILPSIPPPYTHTHNRQTCKLSHPHTVHCGDLLCVTPLLVHDLHQRTLATSVKFFFPPVFRLQKDGTQESWRVNPASFQIRSQTAPNSLGTISYSLVTPSNCPQSPYLARAQACGASRHQGRQHHDSELRARGRKRLLAN